ncbi:MAG: hypothetical protein ACO1N1_09305 [Dyadobacter fermentans]
MQSHVQDLYGLEISSGQLSAITNKIGLISNFKLSVVSRHLQ